MSRDPRYPGRPDTYRESLPPEAQFAIGLLLTLICGALIAVLLRPSWHRAQDRVEQSSSETDAWTAACERRGGTIVHNGKGYPYLLCFSSDGRLVSTR